MTAPEPGSLQAAAREVRTSDALGWRYVHASLWEEQPEADVVEIPASQNHRLVMVTGGHSVVQSRTGSRWRRAVCGPGSIAVTAADHADHLRWRRVGQNRLASIHLRLDQHLVDGAREAYGMHRSHTFPDTLQLDDPAVRASVRDLHHALEVGAPALFADAAAHVLAAKLITSRAPLDRGTSRGLDARVLARVVGHMTDHVGEEVTLDDLAAVANLSKHHLIRQFKAATGQTPHRYLQQLRMERAELLLSRGDCTIRTVARLCGYASERQFSSAFARHAGATPGRWGTASPRTDRSALPSSG